MKSLFAQWDEIAFRTYTEEELHDIHRELARHISIGLHRKEAPTTADGGVMAIPSSVQPISQSQLDQVPNGSPVIIAACGGTNWFFTTARKQLDGSLGLEKEEAVTIYEKDRVHTYGSLMDLIASQVAATALNSGVENEVNLPIAIAFGFPQINYRTPHGDIDARLPMGELPKKWRITDFDASKSIEDQPSLTALLRAALVKHGVSSPGIIVIINDTVAVATDVQHTSADGRDLPVGFVFGTGTNASVYSEEKGSVINLECGYAKAVPEDAIWKQMVKKQYTDFGPIVEQWTGGAHLPYRVAAALQLVEHDELAEKILNAKDQAVISHLAEGRDAGLELTPEEQHIAQEACARALTQAGQMMGIMMSSVTQAAGYTSGSAHVPYEGALLRMGFGVKEAALATLQQLIPGNEIQPYIASGMIGVGKLALVKQHVAPAE